MEYADGEPFDVGDNDESISKMYSNLRADSYLLELLIQMNNLQKVILLFLLLREAGYSLTHEECARTLRITRERYMVLVREVRQKAEKILQIED